MKPIIAFTACLLALPAAAQAASRSYDTGAFEAVSVASGITVDIQVGPARSVVAETSASHFDDLRIAVDGKVLRIDRPSRGWFSFFSRRASYRVQVTLPALRSLSTSSGTQVTVKGNMQGDFAVDSSSGSSVEVAAIKGGAVTANLSSGSQISLTGTCQSLQVRASSGSDLDAEDFQCEKVDVRASSGSELSFGATRDVTGSASSGSQLRVRGGTASIRVEKSSGADVKVRN